MTELDEIHETFLAALAADPDPKSNLALCWHEGWNFVRDAAAPSASTRGMAFLEYFDGPTSKRDVPGQSFPAEKLPFRVCEALIKREAASWTGPRAITFRYDRTDVGWTGGWSIETSEQHRDLVDGRKDLDARMATALRGQWVKGVKQVSLMYGVHGWKTFGPKLRVAELVDPPAEILAIWNEIVTYLHDHGVRHLYSAEYFVTKPKAAAPADGIQLRYDR